MKKSMIAVGCCSMMLAGFFSCNRVQDVATDLLISDEEEIKLGRQYKAQIEADDDEYPLYTAKTGYSDDVVDYIDSIGQNIARHQDDRDIEFTFTVIDNDSVVNAFAVPGGFVYIYTGLIKSARNEAEIAGVLAHEIGHITNRHGAKQMVKQYGIDLLLDVLVGDSSAIRTVMDISSGLLFLNYSRENEFQADSCSVEYLVKTGYNPSGMKTFLEFLADMGGGTAPKLLQFLSTHPPTDERITAVARIIGRKSSDVRSRSIPDVKYTP
ncbi:MAG: M48 family metalloprotease [Chitinispirillaceae bacterium]|nr:M48 family metalloprotease [Chitinispirillaceae bacterium]